MKINILLASIQIRGIDGTGGLGDVPVGLSKILANRGDIDIRLIMPGFGKISGKGIEDRFSPSKMVLEALPVPFGTAIHSVDVFCMDLPQLGEDVSKSVEVPCYLLRCPDVFDKVEADGKINKDSPDKAVFFARTVLEFLNAFRQFPVNLIHCNDWHTALIPVYLRTLYQSHPYLGRVATLYTTHNAEGGFQGTSEDVEKLVALAGLNKNDIFTDSGKPSLNHYNQFNFTKGGFCFSDLINTVSTQYHKELLTPAFGGGLSHILEQRLSRFCGIINGIDTIEWNPQKDSYISPHNFSAEDGVGHVRQKKIALRQKLREANNVYSKLKDNSVLVGIVSRIDYQKTPILLAAIERLLDIKEDFQLIILGSAGAKDETGQKQTDKLESLAANSEKLMFFNGFDIPLSHLIYAASEIFLVPSVFEPCGLTQLVAMNYGSVPIVRAVGGLKDTVIDEGDIALRDLSTGFTFKEEILEPNERMDELRAADKLISTFQRAISLRLKNMERWDQLMINGMGSDWSWPVPSIQYVNLYHEAIRQSLVRSYFGG